MRSWVLGLLLVLWAGATPDLAVASGWSIQPTPNVPGALGSALGNVSCSTPRDCVAVGSYETVYPQTFTLAERWDGVSWQIQPTPNPDGAIRSDFADVSCSGPRSCTAVGGYLTGYGTGGFPLAEHWNGTRWAIQPTPSGVGSGLSGVSCTSARACVAVGGNSSGTMADRWDGSTWQIQPTPSPTGVLGSGLGKVSCTGARSCTAVGTYRTDEDTVGPLAERWDGASWQLEPMPNPGGDSALVDVSCARARACTAVGYYPGTEQIPTATVAERWNGVAWQLQPTPNPDGNPALTGVSCARARACTAVGSSLEISILAERWDGLTWQTEPTPPTPAGAGASGLADVSCIRARACTAVGSYAASPGSFSFDTLAERFTEPIEPRARASVALG